MRIRLHIETDCRYGKLEGFIELCIYYFVRKMCQVKPRCRREAAGGPVRGNQRLSQRLAVLLPARVLQPQCQFPVQFPAVRPRLRILRETAGNQLRRPLTENQFRGETSQSLLGG